MEEDTEYSWPRALRSVDEPSPPVGTWQGCSISLKETKRSSMLTRHFPGPAPLLHLCVVGRLQSECPLPGPPALGLLPPHGQGGAGLKTRGRSSLS